MFEKVITIGILNGGGPDAITPDFELPNLDTHFFIEAWISNFGSSNVHIFSGPKSLADCQSQLERGPVDILMTLASGGPVCRHLPTSSPKLTVFFEGANSSGQAQLVTIKITDSHPNYGYLHSK